MIHTKFDWRANASQIGSGVVKDLRDGWLWSLMGLVTIADGMDTHSFQKAAYFLVTRGALVLAARAVMRGVTFSSNNSPVNG